MRATIFYESPDSEQPSRACGWLTAAALLLLPGMSMAADLDGATLSPLWAVPFIGLLLSIALGPLVAPAFWHHHFGKIAAFWAAVFLLPFAAQFGAMAAVTETAHAALAEYIPFIALLTALYVVAGGIHVRGDLRGTPGLNTGILALGTLLASIMGTTGASMLLIRPLLRANEGRAKPTHIVVFFIFLVANAGGALSPLGDPPLFLGFLKGVDFFWTLQHIFSHTLLMWVCLLALFYLLDRFYFFPREKLAPPDSSGTRLGFDGSWNFLLLVVVIALVLMSGLWKPGVQFVLLGTPVELQNLVRDVLLVAVIGISLWTTPAAARAGNDFNWEPMAEVAKLFAAIFLTIIPVIVMLRAGEQGAFAAVVRAVTGADGKPDDLMYFWVTGVLSSFLDNAPTYLVFFNTASGDAVTMMTRLASTLAAISAGAVFMGAMTYIGNAPNLMVKAIAEARGVRMPSFFGYMGWSCCILLPVFIIMSVLFFI